MIVCTRLLVIGGTGRNVGKTEFVCRLINKLSARHLVYALKVSAIFPDEEIYHGNHSDEEFCGQLIEETRTDTDKDTSRMLVAGATQVFYLRADDGRIQEGFTEFLHRIPEQAVIVCESNSLGQFVRPGLSIMIRPTKGQIKPRALAQLQSADMVVFSDGATGFPELDRINYKEISGWEIQ